MDLIELILCTGEKNLGLYQELQLEVSDSRIEIPTSQEKRKTMPFYIFRDVLKKNSDVRFEESAEKSH